LSIFDYLNIRSHEIIFQVFKAAGDIVAVERDYLIKKV